MNTETKPSIEEMNRVIAEFMGGQYRSAWAFGQEDNLFYMPGNSGLDYVGCFKNDLPYHDSWDWLMPVGKKIDAIIQKQIKERPPHTVSKGDELELELSWAIRVYDLQKAHQCAFDFIIWYNNSQNKQQ